MVRETIGGSASCVKNPATAKKDKEMDIIYTAYQEIHDGSTTDELAKILLNLTFHSAITSTIERFAFLTYIIASTLQVQTTTFSKVRKKNIENTFKTDKYMQKLPREKHVEVKYSPGSIFFSLSMIDRLFNSFPVPYRYRYCYYKLNCSFIVTHSSNTVSERTYIKSMI